jgi:hypothetical protein
MSAEDWFLPSFSPVTFLPGATQNRGKYLPGATQNRGKYLPGASQNRAESGIICLQRIGFSPGFPPLHSCQGQLKIGGNTCQGQLKIGQKGG